jgi:hypothetical protein
MLARPTLLGTFVRVGPYLQHGSLCDSRRKWGIAFDSMAHTSNRSTHASVQDPHLPVSDNCVPRKAGKVCGGIWWSLAAEPLTLWNTFGLVMRPNFTSRGTLTDKTCVSGALSIHIKFMNPLCMPRKSRCGVRFPLRVWLGLSCLRIMSMGRIMPWCSTSWQNVCFWGTQHPHQIHVSILHA